MFVVFCPFHLECFQGPSVCSIIKISFFSGQIIFHCIYLQHLVYSFTYVSLGCCFHLLVIIHNADVYVNLMNMYIYVNLHVHRSVQIPALGPFQCTPWSEMQDCMVILCLTFEEPPNCFPQPLRHFTYPLAMQEGSSFFTSLLTFSSWPCQ